MNIAKLTSLIIMLIASQAIAAPIENVTSSALMPGDSAVFNLDFIDPFGLPIYDIMIKALPSGAATDSTVILDHVPADPRYLTTYGGVIRFSNPAGPIQFYGRVAADTLVVTQSYKNIANQFPPASILYADLAPDAVGDTLPGTIGQWLDLTGCAATYSDTRLYAKLSNVTGSFPTSQGFTTYFVYAVFIANPDTISMSATAMIYANVPLFLSSGLYSVNLADTSFSRIAGISAQVSGGDLHLACNISDLTSDPNFPVWPPESGHAILGGFTLTVTLSAPTFNDYTYPASFMPMTQFLNVTGNNAPVVSNPIFDIVPNLTVNVSCDYLDMDDNLPVTADLLFDRGIYPMGAFDHSYDNNAVFNHLLAWPGEGEHVYFFRFSDGLTTYETPMDTITISPSGIDDGPLPLTFSLHQNYPNPFNATTLIEFNMPHTGRARLAIYDIQGYEVAVLADAAYPTGHQSAAWDGKNSSGHPVSSGIYFYRLSIDGDRSLTKRMLLLK